MADLDMTTYPAHPGACSTSTAASTVTLDVNRRYQFVHCGLDVGGNDTNDEVWGNTDGSTAPDGTAGTQRFTLADQQSTFLGPGVSTCDLLASANDAVISIFPVALEIGRY